MQNITIKPMTSSFLAASKARILALTAVLFFLAGCGYQNPYTATHNVPPLRLYHSMWNNQTNVIELPSIIYHSLSDWLLKSKQIDLQAKTNADYILQGTILSIRNPGLSYDTFDQAKELRVVLTLSFSLKDSRKGEIIWEDKEYTREKSYRVGADALSTNSNKKQALKEIADELAENLYLRLLDYRLAMLAKADSGQ